jgi:cellulose synthase/poly-beta-1,6-N-acetylglucosamine synthase-like glycosyltransferase
MPSLFYVALIFVLFFVYAWSVYNLPILVMGVKNLLEAKQRPRRKQCQAQLPTFSIVVPVKDEEKVLGRLLEALEKLDYPQDKKEVIIVEDGSSDGTLETCRRYSEQHGQLAIKIFSKSWSDGKPSALNYGIKQATGEIIAIFDADNVPASDALLNVCKYFEDPDVAAVQGRTMPINARENMLTRFAAYEDLVWYEVYMRGKDALNLFVHLRGSCQFIKRAVLNELGGFGEHTLSEDMELSVRLEEKGYRIRYASDVVSVQESPARLAQLFRQRTRWFRGTMEVALKYGRLMAKPSARRIDAEATLFGPLILVASLVTYFGAFYAAFSPASLSLLVEFVMKFALVILTTTFFMCGLALVYSSKPRKVTSLLWLPFIYFYWSFQAFIASYAVMLILLRRPQKWLKTDKNGSADPSFLSEA